VSHWRPIPWLRYSVVLLRWGVDSLLHCCGYSIWNSFIVIHSHCYCVHWSIVTFLENTPVRFYTLYCSFILITYRDGWLPLLFIAEGTDSAVCWFLAALFGLRCRSYVLLIGAVLLLHSDYGSDQTFSIVYHLPCGIVLTFTVLWRFTDCDGFWLCRLPFLVRIRYSLLLVLSCCSSSWIFHAIVGWACLWFVLMGPDVTIILVFCSCCCWTAFTWHTDYGIDRAVGISRLVMIQLLNDAFYDLTVDIRFTLIPFGDLVEVFVVWLLLETIAVLLFIWLRYSIQLHYRPPIDVVVRYYRRYCWWFVDYDLIWGIVVLVTVTVVVIHSDITVEMMTVGGITFIILISLVLITIRWFHCRFVLVICSDATVNFVTGYSTIRWWWDVLYAFPLPIRWNCHLVSQLIRFVVPITYLIVTIAWCCCHSGRGIAHIRSTFFIYHLPVPVVHAVVPVAVACICRVVHAVVQMILEFWVISITGCRWCGTFRSDALLYHDGSLFVQFCCTLPIPAFGDRTFTTACCSYWVFGAFVTLFVFIGVVLYPDRVLLLLHAAIAGRLQHYLVVVGWYLPIPMTFYVLLYHRWLHYHCVLCSVWTFFFPLFCGHWTLHWISWWMQVVMWRCSFGWSSGGDIYFLLLF